LIAQVVRAYGFSKVWIGEVNPFRLKLAQNMGFEVIDTKKCELLDKILTFTNGEGRFFF